MIGGPIIDVLSQGPTTDYVLIVTVTTVTSGCLLTVVGRLGDIFGRRYFLIGGQCFGVIGGIIGATAKYVNTLIGGSVFMGFAGAVQLTFTFVMCELVPNKHRAYVDAILFASVIPFAAMGPAIGMSLYTNIHCSEPRHLTRLEYSSSVCTKYCKGLEMVLLHECHHMRHFDYSFCLVLLPTWLQAAAHSDVEARTA